MPTCAWMQPVAWFSSGAEKFGWTKSSWFSQTFCFAVGPPGTISAMPLLTITCIIWKCSDGTKQWDFSTPRAIFPRWTDVASYSIWWPRHISTTCTKPAWVALSSDIVLTLPFTIIPSCARSRFMGPHRAEKSFLALPSSGVCWAKTVSWSEIVVILGLVWPGSIHTEKTWCTRSTWCWKSRIITKLSPRTWCAVSYTQPLLETIIKALTAWKLRCIFSPIGTVMAFWARIGFKWSWILRAEVPCRADKASSLAFIRVIRSSSTAQWISCAQLAKVSLRARSSNCWQIGRSCSIWASSTKKSWSTFSCLKRESKGFNTTVIPKKKMAEGYSCLCSSWRSTR